MQIAKDTVVSFDYTLTDDEGTLLDSSDGRNPLVYLHGRSSIIPGLETALDGHTEGDELKVSIPPEQGYGARNEGLCVELSRSQFSEAGELAVGMQFRVADDDGNEQILTIVELDDENVTVDGNHPLAGLTLCFHVTVRDVRVATEDEISQGQANVPDEA